MMPRTLDLTGQRFGRLVATNYMSGSRSTRGRWRCVCDCGNETNVITSQLKNGRTRSCGCLRLAEDLVGQKFGRLTVVQREKCINRQLFWRCVCDCGRIKNVDAKHLRDGNTRSCGCLRREVVAAWANARKTSKEHKLELARRNAARYRLRWPEKVKSEGKKRYIKNVRLGKPTRPTKDWYRARAKRQISGLHRSYIISLIQQAVSLPAKDIPENLIEAKREHVKLTRLLKEEQR